MLYIAYDLFNAKTDDDLRSVIGVLFDTMIEDFTKVIQLIRISHRPIPNIESICHIGYTELKDNKRIDVFAVRTTQIDTAQLTKALFTIDLTRYTDAIIIVFYDDNHHFSVSLTIKNAGKYKKYTYSLNQDNFSTTIDYLKDTLSHYLSIPVSV